MMRRFFADALCGALVIAALFLPRPAHAHKVRVFALPEGGKIMVEGAFSGDRMCQDCRVEVLNPETREVILRGRTDQKGLWRFPVSNTVKKARSGLLVVLEAGEGHRAEWLVRPSEYLDETGPVDKAPAKVGKAASSAKEGSTLAPGLPSPSAPEGSAPKGQAVSAPLDEARLEAVVARAVEREVAPLRRMLLEQEEGPGWKDILGGIGWIVGLAGIAVWARSRRS